MYTTAPQAMAMMAELALKGPEKIVDRVDWKGLEIIDEMRRNDEKVIFLVPHGWGVDIPAMLMASQGQKMAAMFHNQGNKIYDFVWNTVRRRFGGRLHARNDGIKPFIQSVRQGYWGYYLPDQDHGREASLFAPFFNHPKATLPALPRLVKLTGARALPVLACYDEQAHGYRLEVEAPYADYPSGDLMADTCRMNDSVERQLCRHPGQYMWFLKIFDTREDQVGPDGLYEEGIRRIRRGLAPHP